MPVIEMNSVGGPFAVLPSRPLCPLSPLPDKSDPTAENIAIRFPRFLPSPDNEPKMWTVRIGGVHTFSFGRWRSKQTEIGAIQLWKSMPQKSKYSVQLF